MLVRGCRGRWRVSGNFFETICLSKTFDIFADERLCKDSIVFVINKLVYKYG